MEDRKNDVGNIIRSTNNFSEAEEKQYIQLFRDIISKKREGFVWMATTDGERVHDEESNGPALEAEGILFLNRSDKLNVAMNLLRNLDLDPLDLAVREKARNKHNPKCDGHCND